MSSLERPSNVSRVCLERETRTLVLGILFHPQEAVLYPILGNHCNERIAVPITCSMPQISNDLGVLYARS